MHLALFYTDHICSLILKWNIEWVKVIYFMIPQNMYILLAQHFQFPIHLQAS